MKLHIPTPCFFKTLQVQSPETQTEMLFLNANKQPSGQHVWGFSNQLRLWIFSPPSSKTHRNGSGSFRIDVVILLGIWGKFPCSIHVIITPYRSHSWSLYNTPNDNKMWKEFLLALKYFASYEDPEKGSLLKFSPCQGFHLYPPSI